ncbi:O-antigen ligase family protein [Candidatus Microgenomates bacterium]|nr:O-antigen ligase family protein [Candidatus Microgenomates bacterium]
MKYLVILLLVVFPFGQLVRLPLFGTEAVLHLNDLAVILTLLVARPKFSGPVAKALGLFLAAAVISLLHNFTNFTTRELIISALYPLRFAAYAGLYFVFKKVDPALTRRWLVLATVIVAIAGLLQYLFIPNVSFLSALNWDDHYYRLVGPFLDPGFTGIIILLGLILAFLNFKNFITLLTFYLAFALTYSRASYLAYLVSFVALAWYKKSVKTAIIAALIMGATILVLPKSTGEGTKLERENSIIARLRNYQESLTIWQKAPIFGVGFDTYRYVRGIGPESHAGAGADSSLLLVLATTGVVGFTAYLNLLRVMWQTGKASLVFKASFLAILVHSFFNNTLFYPWVMEWLWITLGILSERSESKDLV